MYQFTQQLCYRWEQIFGYLNIWISAEYSNIKIETKYTLQNLSCTKVIKADGLELRKKQIESFFFFSKEKFYLYTCVKQ